MKYHQTDKQIQLPCQYCHDAVTQENHKFAEY